MTIYTSSSEPVPKWSEEGVFDFIFKNTPAKDDKAALIDVETGVELSYGQLREDALCYARGLIDAGVESGSTILLFSPNSLLYAVMLFASQAAGITASTANSSYTPSELAHQLEAASATVILVGSDLAPIAQEAAKEVGIKQDRIYVMPGTDGSTKVPKGCRSYEELKGEKGFKNVKIQKEKLSTTAAFLPFSSGTTSRPKGVQISHSNITSVSLQLRQHKGLFNKPEVVMGCLPLYHIYGLIVVLHQTLYNGGTVILMPKFDLPKLLEAVQKYKVTVGLLVPPICLALAKHPIVDKYDMSSIRYLMSGAAPLSADLQSTLAKRIDTLVLQGWGMSETTSVGLLPDVDDWSPGNCGKLLSSMEARLVDEDGKDAKAGEPGELWVRGKNIMLKYHKNDKATDETITSEGWLKTGDVCVRSKDGKYTIVDRTKELIKVKGFQVPPAELEGVLLSCPLVADAAVIGVWSEERATEYPRAYIVPDAAHAKDKDLEKKVAEFVAGKVAKHKQLRGGVIVINEIPKSPSGKILRKDLRVMAAKEDEKNKSKL